MPETTIDPPQRIVGRDHFTKDSQELRITSPADARLRFVGGLFYQRQTHLIHQDYQVAGLADNLSVNGYPGTLWLTQQNRVDRDYAAFGEASFDILSNLTLTGGLRGYKYDNSLIGFFGFGRDPNGPPYNAAGSSRTGVAGCYTTTGQTLRDNPGGTLSAGGGAGQPLHRPRDLRERQVSFPRPPRAAASPTVSTSPGSSTPDQMVYATWSAGSGPAASTAAAPWRPIRRTTLINYEIGFKTSWPGHLIAERRDLPAGLEEVPILLPRRKQLHRNPQRPRRADQGRRARRQLAAGPRLQPARERRLYRCQDQANLCGFDDPTYTCTQAGNFVSAPGRDAPAGDAAIQGLRHRPLRIPRHQRRHQRAYPDGGGRTRARPRRTCRTLIFAPGTGATVDPAALTGRLPAYTTVDFAVGLDWHKYTAELFVENAFDDRAEITRFQECGECFQRPYAVVARPRTIGIRLGTKF